MSTTPHGSEAVDDLRVETASAAPPGPDASLSDLISRLGDDVTLLFRQEVELAKVELKREATTAAKASGMFAAAGVAGLVTLLLLAWAAAWGLAEVVPTGVAFLIVGIVFGLIAAGLAMAGKKRFEQVDFTPHATIETLQEDKQVITDRMSS
ncbi:phage holin family protein [Egicoccus sp. AB-alg6-2]|uniref:phage holin family protein n=1 Tax=Egicoccus sp. AB-alg6-2 TaxID=3242692 RepID=UPI00359E1D6A